MSITLGKAEIEPCTQDGCRTRQRDNGSDDGGRGNSVVVGTVDRRDPIQAVNIDRNMSAKGIGKKL